MEHGEQTEQQVNTESVISDYKKLSDQSIEHSDDEYLDWFTKSLKIEEQELMDNLRTIDPDYTVAIKASRLYNESQLHKMKAEINWQYIDLTSDQLPNISIRNSSTLQPKLIHEVSQDIARSAAITGLLGSSSENSERMIYKADVVVKPNSQMDGAIASATATELSLSESFFNDSELIKTLVKSEETRKSLNENDSEIAGQFLRKFTIAHEIYHLRQQQVLALRSEYNKDKFKQEKGLERKMLDTTYEYNSDERSADAFALRHLREEYKLAPEGSRESDVLEKLITDIYYQQAEKAATYKQAIINDKAS